MIIDKIKCKKGEFPFMLFSFNKHIKKISAVLLLILLTAFIPVYAAPYKEHKITANGTVIEAEDYDTEDWYDITENDESYAYREDGAQTEYCQNYERDDTPDLNFNIGWTADDEWVQYTVDVETSGRYKIDVWLASQPSSGGAEIFYDGKSVGDTYANDSADWQDWVLCSVGQVDMTAGRHIIKVVLTESVNIDAIVITPAENTNTQSGNVIVENCTCEHDFNAMIEEYMKNTESGGKYTAAQDLSETETAYTIAVIAVTVAAAAITAAISAIVLYVLTIKKLNRRT